MAFDASRCTADCFVITPSTNGATTFTSFGFYVGGTSGQTKNVNVITSRGNTRLFTGIPTGTTIDRVVISGVRTTNTTATSIMGFGPQ